MFARLALLPCVLLYANGMTGVMMRWRQWMSVIQTGPVSGRTR
jgi:hypothetical protein